MTLIALALVITRVIVQRDGARLSFSVPHSSSYLWEYVLAAVTAFVTGTRQVLIHLLLEMSAVTQAPLMNDFSFFKHPFQTK